MTFVTLKTFIQPKIGLYPPLRTIIKIVLSISLGFCMNKNTKLIPKETIEGLGV